MRNRVLSLYVQGYFTFYMQTDNEATLILELSNKYSRKSLFIFHLSMTTPGCPRKAKRYYVLASYQGHPTTVRRPLCFAFVFWQPTSNLRDGLSSPRQKHIND